MDKFFFPLREGYYYGRRLNKELRDIMGNRLVQDAHATGLLAQAVVNSGHGDYVEIGSLHGGSAITAALVKKEFKLKGNIYCIEPSPRDILENAQVFGVRKRIIVYQNNSKDFNFVDVDNFTCGFIDGDHRDPHPLEDFNRLENHITRYLVFDDYDKSEPGVQRAVEYAMDYENLWRPVHISNALAIFERIT